MNSQELRNLQEAYLDVYRNVEKPEQLDEGSQEDDRIRRNTHRGQNEDYDIYDLILSHLLDEGYAETPEAAEVIMVNMSEEWVESIVEEFEQLDEIMKHQQERDRIEGMKKKSSRARTWSYEPPTKGKHGEIERRQAQRPPSRLRSGKLPREREEG